MWRHTLPLDNLTLSEFERTFSFRIEPVFRSFLLEHNCGCVTPGVFSTVKCERKLWQLLNFADRTGTDGAWAINKRLQEQLGPMRIVVGLDIKGNFVCLEREHKRQKIVVWSHLSGEFEESILDIPAFLRVIG